MKSKIDIYIDENCYYLVLDLNDMNLYERAKAINKFIKNDTKVLENYVDKEIKAIFERNGINVVGVEQNGYKGLFDTLKRKGKDIVINDLYKNKLYGCQKVVKSDNYMNVQIEDNRYLQCGVEVKEISL